MKSSHARIITVVLVTLIIGIIGGSALAMHQNDTPKQHDAMVMQQSAAMKKANEAKAMKADEDAAMKKEAADKAMTGDAMMHDDNAAMTAGQ